MFPRLAAAFGEEVTISVFEVDKRIEYNRSIPFLSPFVPVLHKVILSANEDLKEEEIVQEFKDRIFLI